MAADLAKRASGKVNLSAAYNAAITGPSLGGKEEDRREAAHHHPQNEDTVEVHDRTLGLRNVSGFCRTAKSLIESSLAISGRAIKSGRFLQSIFEDFSAHEGMKVRSGKHPIEYGGAKTGAFVSASDDRPCGASR